MARISYPVYSQPFDPYYMVKKITTHSWGVTPLPPAPAPFTVVSVVGSPSLITLTFNYPVTVSGLASDPEQWTVVRWQGSVLPVRSVSVVGAKILLATEEQTDSLYNMVLPNGIVSTSSELFTGPFDASFTGVGVPPTVLDARSIDARTIQIQFGETVVESEALDPSNYSVTRDLTVSAVTKISETIYRLTTSRQSVGTAYEITASGIHDLAGNLI